MRTKGRHSLLFISHRPTAPYNCDNQEQYCPICQFTIGGGDSTPYFFLLKHVRTIEQTFFFSVAKCERNGKKKEFLFRSAIVVDCFQLSSIVSFFSIPNVFSLSLVIFERWTFISPASAIRLSRWFCLSSPLVFLIRVMGLFFLILAFW